MEGSICVNQLGLLKIFHSTLSNPPLIKDLETNGGSSKAGLAGGYIEAARVSSELGRFLNTAVPASAFQPFSSIDPPEGPHPPSPPPITGGSEGFPRRPIVSYPTSLSPVDRVITRVWDQESNVCQGSVGCLMVLALASKSPTNPPIHPAAQISSPPNILSTHPPLILEQNIWRREDPYLALASKLPTHPPSCPDILSSALPRSLQNWAADHVTQILGPNQNILGQK